MYAEPIIAHNGSTQTRPDTGLSKPSGHSRVHQIALLALSFRKKKDQLWYSAAVVISSILIFAILDYQVSANYSVASLYYIPLLIAAVSFDLKWLGMVAITVTVVHESLAPYVCDHALPGSITLPHLCRGYISDVVIRAMMNGIVAAACHAFVVLYTKERELMARNEALAGEVAQAQYHAGIGRGASVLVHEIKNPICAIASAVSYLRSLSKSGSNGNGSGKHSNDSLDEWLEIVHSEARRLTEMADSILDYTSGRALKLNLQTVRLDSVVSELRPLWKAAAEHAGLRLLWEVEPAAPVALDVPRFRQVLVNLFANSVQATPRGGTISLKAGMSGTDAILIIEDSGRGIAEHVQQRLFEPFTSHGKPNGLGLGLAIARQIVLAHNGDIQAESKVGVGTTFTITLPAHAPSTVETSALRFDSSTLPGQMVRRSSDFDHDLNQDGIEALV